jgi:NAD(P)H-dependent flavin oxidoreductase YrpB (nitropropane dioxygenase family)
MAQPRRKANMNQPIIIQGGMGIGVSGWRLARAVASRGHLGVVSGTAIAHVIAGRLRRGDSDVAEAFEAFPDAAVADNARRLCLRRDMSNPEEWRALPMATIDGPLALVELTMVASFAEIWLAKRGHHGIVGINLLEKIALPTAPTLYGAMLAGVDYVLVGAGIPRAIPGILDRLAEHLPVDVKIPLENSADDDVWSHFNPRTIISMKLAPLTRPAFLAIVASDVLAQSLVRNASGRIDGFIVESPVAGGHNAPPRGGIRVDARGEPVYGPRDVPDMARLRALGVPFWLAGGRASRQALLEAQAAGAVGVQIGTAFAFCHESGIDDSLKRQVLRSVIDGTVDLFTDPRASPTGFPFKIARVPGTVGVDDVYAARMRICDMGYLREAYRRPDGTVGFRCAGEPVTAYVAKGGNIADAAGRKCLCNGLLATVGFAQKRATGAEPAMVTAGDAVRDLRRFIGADGSYDAATVIDDVLTGCLKSEAC